jgi:hypothetical protein
MVLRALEMEKVVVRGLTATANRFFSCPSVRLKDPVECGILRNPVGFHHPANRRGNAGEINPTIHERLDSDLVRGVEDGGEGSARISGPTGQRKSGKAICVRVLES